jgi:hypothetical protein
MGAVARIFADSVMGWYRRRLAEGVPEARGGVVTVIQRSSSDMKLNPHLHGERQLFDRLRVQGCGFVLAGRNSIQGWPSPWPYPALFQAPDPLVSVTLPFQQPGKS